MTLLFLVAFVSILYLFFRPQHHHTPRPRTVFKDLSSIRSLLANSTLASRAIPNERLIRAFNISNSFTTTSLNNHRHSKKQAEDLLKAIGKDWASLAAFTQSITRKYFPVSASRPFNLSGVIRGIVLTVAIHTFFPSTPESDPEDIATLAMLIHNLWIQSKTSCSPLRRLQQRRSLALTLRKLFPGLPETPENNPLNLILPAYETLWRVVLRLFLEIAFREEGTQQGVVYRRLLREYLASPDDRCSFTRVIARVSMETLTKETLRLYPPTKRINRFDQGVDAAADVEAVHYDCEIWGEDAGQFRPSRWMERDDARADTMARAYLAFGTGAFVCPAKGAFAGRILGILVAVLVEKFDEEEVVWRAEAQDEVEGAGVALRNERDSYGTLQFELR